MFFYIILFSLIVFSTLKYSNKKIGIFWFFTLSLLSILRADTVGTDTLNYINAVITSGDVQLSLNYNSEEILDKKYEISYAYIKSFLNKHDLSPRYINVVFSVITYIFLYLTLKKIKLSYNIGIALFSLLFFLPSLNIARQICASCIVLYAYTFLYDNSFKKYLFFIFVIIASTFHISSMIYIICYIIRYIKTEWFNKKSLEIFAIVFFFINLLFSSVINDFFTSKFSNFAYINIYSNIIGSQERSLIGIIYSFMNFSSYYVIFTKYSDKRINKYDFLFYCSIICIAMSTTMHSNISRIFLPIQIFQILYVCKLYNQNKIRIKDYGFIYYIFVNIFMVVYALSVNSGEVIPYKMDLNFQ